MAMVDLVLCKRHVVGVPGDFLNVKYVARIKVQLENSEILNRLKTSDTYTMHMDIYNCALVNL